jgi:hypothetical protein
MTSAMQMGITFAALVIAAAAAYFAYFNAHEARNAALVSIRVAVLRADPEKEKDISIAAREWALDLIDANAGGVKFSTEARTELLKNALHYSGGYDNYTYADEPQPLPGPGHRVTPPLSDLPRAPTLPAPNSN